MRALELKVPPGVVVLLAIALMWLVARAGPRFDVALPARGVWAAIFFAAGVAIVAAGVISFRRAGTTINPLKPASASALVTTGIYRWTRNPMYLGLLLMLISWAWVLANVLAWLVLPGFVAYLWRFQIMPEERALAALFGREFAGYKARVRRWL